MEIIIGKRLRELRRERGATQEALAEHLSVSPQAVSKWEREEGYPDITLLPSIATFLDVSVDDLLGVGDIRKQEKINEYLDKTQKLEHIGHWDEAVEVMRKAHAEFPNDMRVLKDLVVAISNSDIKDSQQQVIPLCKRILDECNDTEIRSVALAHLCYAYSNLGDSENGRKYAEIAPRLGFGKEMLLPLFLGGNELKNEIAYDILECYDLIWLLSLRLMQAHNHEPDESIRIAKAFLKISDAVFDDGFCGFYYDRVRQMNFLLAKFYAIKNDEESAKEHLLIAADFAAKYDAMPDRITYTSTLIKGHEKDMTETTGHGASNCSTLFWMINENKAVFEKYSDREWYKSLIAKLKVTE